MQGLISGLFGEEDAVVVVVSGGSAVYRFRAALSVGSVGITDGAVSCISYGGQVSCIVPGHGLSIVFYQFVFPDGIVGVGMADAVSGLGKEVAAVVVGIGVGGGLSVRVGLHSFCDFAVFVVGVGLLAAGPVFDACDVAPCVISVGVFGHGGPELPNLLL